MIEEANISLAKACSDLKMSRSNYYNWKTKEELEDADKHLRKEIEGIVLEFPFYGYRRVTKELCRRKIFVNHKHVLRIMKEDNLIRHRKKAFRPLTTDSNHNYNIYPNLIKNLKVTGLNQVWTVDITYIRLLREFIYLAAIEDLFSRKCVGWALGRDINTLLTIDALNMAITNRKKFGFAKLIHHSDRGVQYASNEYVELLEKDGIRISMSASGNPYDNAFVCGQFYLCHFIY